jgi:hypothetical protein
MRAVVPVTVATETGALKGENPVQTLGRQLQSFSRRLEPAGPKPAPAAPPPSPMPR